MAGINFAVQSGETACVAATAKTVLQLVAPSNHRLRVKEFSLTSKGTNNTAAPVLVELVRQSDAGTSSAATPVALDESTDETLQATARKTVTAEPTGTVVVKSFEVHPQAGFVWQSPFGGEIPIKGGTRLGIRVTAPADVTVNAEFVAEE